MPQIIMAGQNFNEIGWDGICRLAAEAARDNHPALAMAYVSMANQIPFEQWGK